MEHVLYDWSGNTMTDRVGSERYSHKNKYIFINPFCVRGRHLTKTNDTLYPEWCNPRTVCVLSLVLVEIGFLSGIICFWPRRVIFWPALVKLSSWTKCSKWSSVLKSWEYIHSSDVPNIENRSGNQVTVVWIFRLI